MGARGNSGVILSQILRGIAATLKGAADARRRRRSPTRSRRRRPPPTRRCSRRSRARSSPSCGRAPTRRARGGRRRGVARPRVVRAARDAGRVVARSHPGAAAGARRRRRGRRRRRRLPAAARRRAARRRRRAAARAAARQGDVGGAVGRPTASRARRQRAALRGDVLLRPRRRAHRGAQAGLGSDRRLDRRRRRRRACGTATSTPTTSARRSRRRSTSTAGRTGSASPTCSRRSPPSTPCARPALIVSRRAELPAVTCAVVAVSSGPGISELFRELGVQAVVTGGQTLNPSTAELLAAVERVNADQVVVLPGQQEHHPGRRAARRAHRRKTVRVVPTRSMPEGLAALMVYDPEATRRGQHGGDAPGRRGDRHRRGHRAVRASQTDAGPVAEGDWMGIVRGDGIVAVAPDLARRRHRRCSSASSTTTASSSPSSPAPTPTTATTAALEAWLADQPPRRRGRGARRRPAAVPVPLRRRVGRVTRRPPLTLRELAGDRRRPGCAASASASGRRSPRVGHRDRARPADDVPAAVGRPHQRGPGRRPRARHGGARAGVGALGAQADRPQPADDRRGRRRRRHRTDARRVLQPAVARAPADARACRSRCSARSTRTAAGCRWPTRSST